MLRTFPFFAKSLEAWSRQVLHINRNASPELESLESSITLNLLLFISTKFQKNICLRQTALSYKEESYKKVHNLLVCFHVGKYFNTLLNL